MYYWKIIWRVIKMTTMRDMSYSFDYLIGVVVQFFYYVIQLLFIGALFELTGIKELVGFSVYEVMFVMTLANLAYQLAMLVFIPSIHEFQWQIHRGYIDKFLLWPKSIFMIMFQNSWFVEILIAVVYHVLVLGWLWIELDLSAINFLYVAALLLLALIVYGALIWITVLVMFYYDNFKALQRFVGNMLDVSNFPRVLYPKYIQNIFFYVVPLFIVANPMYDIFAGTFSLKLLVEMLLVTSVMILLVVFVWRDGLKRYNSAS